jgi:hypothetical protein
VVTTQLRVYTVREGRLDEWVRLWRDHSGPESFEEANAVYWASPERQVLGIDPEDFLVDERIQVVHPVL